MSTADDLYRMKSKAEQAERDYHRAQGGAEAAMAKLRQDFGCSTIEEAEAKLGKLRKRYQKLEEGFAKAFAEFEATWGKTLR